MIPVRAYAAPCAGAPLAPWTFNRREPGEHDVVIDIHYCGICHSDIHSARGEWGESDYPKVPGHEIAGRISRIGKRVTRFKIGDLAGIGCYVDTCRRCAACKRGEEVYCENLISFTYASTEQDGITPTYGGYSTQIVVDENYTLKIPAGAPLERVAPLLCAGITTYSPLKHWKVGPGTKAGVVGLGGLGHMAVKLAASFGAEVTVLSTSPAKEADAHRLGAKHFVLTTEKPAMDALANKLDFILNTVSAPHNISALLGLLRTDGTMVLVGASPDALPVEPFALIDRRRTLAGSLIGGLRQTQEMLDYCVAKNLLADVEVIPSTQINDAYDRAVKQDVRYRFVIDAKTF